MADEADPRPEQPVVSDSFDLADPRNWQTGPNKPGAAGPVDIYWEWAPCGGWYKLQNPIRCF